MINAQTTRSLRVRLLAMLVVVFGLLVGLVKFVPTRPAGATTIPRIFNYQAKLTNSLNVTVANGTQSVAFVIYDASSGGTCLWSGANTDANTGTVDCGAPGQMSVTVTDGVFSVLLGDTTGGTQNAIPAFADSVAALFLGVRVGADAEMTPRKQIVSSLLAEEAADAELLDGFNSSQTGGTSAFVPVTSANGNLTLTGDPQGSGVTQGVIIVNPAGAQVATNDTLFGIAVGSAARFTVDGEGDAALLGNLTFTGGGTILTDSGNLVIDSASSLDIRDTILNTAGVLAIGDDTTWTLGATQKLLIDANSSTHTDTTGVIDLNLLTGSGGAVGIDVSATSNNTLTGSATVTGIRTLITPEPGDAASSGYRGSVVAIPSATSSAGVTLFAGEGSSGGSATMAAAGTFRGFSATLNNTSIGATRGLDLTVTNTGSTGEVTGLLVDANRTVAGGVLNGLDLRIGPSVASVGNAIEITEDGSGTGATGINFTTGTWDTGIDLAGPTFTTGIILSTPSGTELMFSDASPVISFANTGNFTINDGTNPFLTITDLGSTSSISLGSGLVELNTQSTLLIAGAPAAIAGNRLSHLRIIGNYTEASSGTHSIIAPISIPIVTVTDGGGTEVVTNLASIYIAGAPLAGTTPTNGPYALFIDAGDLRLDGNLVIQNGNTLSFTDGTNTLMALADGGTTGNLDVSGTLMAGTSDAFQVSAAGTVTIAASQSYTGAGAVTLSSSGGGGLTLDSASGLITLSDDLRLTSAATRTIDVAAPGAGGAGAEFQIFGPAGGANTGGVGLAGGRITVRSGAGSAGAAGFAGGGGARLDLFAGDAGSPGAGGGGAAGGVVRIQGGSGSGGGANGWVQIGTGINPDAPFFGVTSLFVQGQLEVDGSTRFDGGVTIGDGGDSITVDSNDWDISSTGVLTGIDSIANTAGLTISITGAATLQLGDTTDTVTIAIADAAATEALCHATNDNVGTVVEAIIDCSGAPDADYAEQYPMATDVTYGYVVVLGTQPVTTTQGDTVVELVKSSAPYQATAVGVVSNNYNDFTSAGYNIRSEDNPMPVALAGRVPVKVTTENGTIAPGDYLTTSSMPGHAMKATHTGRVIGMALNSLSGDVPGTVMMFVMNGWFNGATVEMAKNTASTVDALALRTIDLAGDLTLHGGTISGIGRLLSESGSWSLDDAGALKVVAIETERLTTEEFTVRRTDRRELVGEATIPQGTQILRVSNDLVEEGSKIFVTFRSRPPTGWWISGTGAGWFELSLSEPSVDGDLVFDYWIVQVLDIRSGNPEPTLGPGSGQETHDIMSVESLAASPEAAPAPEEESSTVQNIEEVPVEVPVIEEVPVGEEVSPSESEANILSETSSPTE